MMTEADLGQRLKSGVQRDVGKAPSRAKVQEEVMRFQRIGIPAVAAAVAQMKARPADALASEDNPSVPHEADAG